MKSIPKTLPLIAVIALISTSYAAPILPTVANPNAQLNSGIVTAADFDWSQTNAINNPNFFKEAQDNFFTGVNTGRGISYLASENAFLNAKKVSVNRHDKGGKSRKLITDIKNSGVRGYNSFGQSQRYTLGATDTVTGMGADTGNGNERFEIVGGAAGAAMNVDISFRTKSDAESYGYHTQPDVSGDDHYTNDKLIGHSPLVGNVMRLHGMGIQEASSDGRIKTNPFALEATYTDADFEATFSLSELEELLNGCLFLGWLNPAIDGDPTSVSDGDRWVNAVQGNFDNMPDNPNRHNMYGVIGDPLSMTLQDYIDGTTTSILGLSKASGEIRVGDYGGWHGNNTVWAITDHNSDFAVVPEPSTYALIGGIICLISVALRRRK